MWNQSSYQFKISINKLRSCKNQRESGIVMIDNNRYYSGLFCISCLCDMDEDVKGNFRCPHCRVEIGVLRWSLLVPVIVIVMELVWVIVRNVKNIIPEITKLSNTSGQIISIVGHPDRMQFSCRCSNAQHGQCKGTVHKTRCEDGLCKCPCHNEDMV